MSDGGVTGLTMAIDYPERVDRLVTIGANFSPAGLTDLVTNFMSSPENIENTPISEVYQEYAPDPTHWHVLIEKLWAMTLSGPNYTQVDLAKIQAPVLVMEGERDRFIRFEHTEELSRMIPNASLLIVPQTGHNVFEVNQYVPREAVNVAIEAVLAFLMAE